MADEVFIIKGCVITVEFGATTVTCAVGQGGEVTVDFDVSELFGQESVTREEAWVEAVHPRISIAHAKWDGQLLGELFGTTSADIDVDGTTKTGYTQATITGASYDHPSFSVKGVFQNKDGDGEFAFLMENVFFTSLGLPFPREGNIIRNLEGTGDVLKVHYATPA